MTIVVVFVWTNIPIFLGGFYYNILWWWPILPYHAYFTWQCMNISDIPWISNIYFFGHFFLSFLHSSGQHYESHVIFWNRVLCIHHIFFSGLIFDFFITVIILTNFVYEQYMIKLNNFWSRDYVMDYMYKYLLPGSILFCSKLKNCIILQAAD